MRIEVKLDSLIEISVHCDKCKKTLHYIGSPENILHKPDGDILEGELDLSGYGCECGSDESVPEDYGEHWVLVLQTLDDDVVLTP